MSCLWLGIAGALAGAPSDRVPTTDTPATEDRTAEAPMWTGGSRDQIYDIVGVEGQVKAIGSSMNELQLISAELDWGDYVTTPGATNAEDDQTGFSHSSLTVTRERVLDASLVDSVTSMTNPDTYDLSDPDEGARLCARLPTGRADDMHLHTWTQNSQPSGANDMIRRGDSPSILVAEGIHSRTAMIALEPGESVTLIEISDRANRRVQRRLEVQRQRRTLTVTEGTATSKVCLEY